MVDVTVLGLVALVPLIALSAFFSSSETAIFSLPADTPADASAGEGGRSAATLQRLRGDPHRLLVTLLVGNNLVNIALSAILTVLASRVLPPAAAVLATTVVGSVLILVFGEIVPKSYGLGHARTWSVRVARPLALVERLLGPLVWAFDGATRRLSGLIGGDSDVEEPYLGG